MRSQAIVRGVRVMSLNSIYECVAPPTSGGGTITHSTLCSARNPCRSGRPERGIQGEER
ncbi:hypothetical protein POSPLADRAFT_1039467 [Postia placenta MAD-698-R-SB12]|uniref:Uncharacterized protein n=1 Tax=Postia placenta MAD-698-R-SB12 TaxID=670580 RepID=A0A1X6N445_9APHY|nr:hypothetical protein POSPLADRAFT_1039467 [Postia placenta MAD-698-R-SB12]OSX63193.1 hypothetical protein POSPLADRAFT_1039467 [Postia placenta MAD-698-R-SB12]